VTIIINEKIIATKILVKDSTEVIKEMGKRLLQAGLVYDNFIPAVIQREEFYPTGLPTKIPVSLCHTDAEYITASFLTLATLKKPIPFREMGNPESIQDVKIVFVLGVKEKNEHTAVLKKIMELIRDERLLKLIYDSKSAIEIKEILIDNIISISQ
jgi:galactitol PTS system EIIA component